MSTLCSVVWPRLVYYLVAYPLDMLWVAGLGVDTYRLVRYVMGRLVECCVGYRELAFLSLRHSHALHLDGQVRRCIDRHVSLLSSR